MTEKYDNSGAIFINDKKEREGHPDRTGQATIDGVDYWVSGWLKKGRDGNPWLSLAFRKKEAQSKPVPVKSNKQAPDFDESDIPF